MRPPSATPKATERAVQLPWREGPESGKKTCDELVKSGGVCAFNSIDLGIAACSAASIASQNRVDSRVMFSLGKACLELQLFSADVKQAVGIPLSVTGTSPFFDRTS